MILNDDDDYIDPAPFFLVGRRLVPSPRHLFYSVAQMFLLIFDSKNHLSGDFILIH